MVNLIGYSTREDKRHRARRRATVSDKMGYDDVLMANQRNWLDTAVRKYYLDDREISKKELDALKVSHHVEVIDVTTTADLSEGHASSLVSVYGERATVGDDSKEVVYIVEKYLGDESSIVGVYHSLSGAQASVEGQWTEGEAGWWFIGPHELWPDYTISVRSVEP
jgi:hypothetical protein